MVLFTLRSVITCCGAYCHRIDYWLQLGSYRENRGNYREKGDLGKKKGGTKFT